MLLVFTILDERLYIVIVHSRSVSHMNGLDLDRAPLVPVLEA
jgi:hypothetical protein